MIGTDGCISLLDGGRRGSGMADGAEMPIDPAILDPPPVASEPGIPDVVGCIPGIIGDIPGTIGGGAGVVAVIPDVDDEVPPEGAVGVRAGYVASAGPGDVDPLLTFFCCGCEDDACGLGVDVDGVIRFAVSTPRMRNPVANSNPAII
jgi:hypothetical protein